MGTTLRRIRVSVVGNVKDAKKIPGWMRENGGAYSKDVSRNVTHLIASEEAYKANVQAVKKAKALGTVKIVSFDWIEDSLCSRTKRPKPEEPYLWKNLLRAETEEQPGLQKRAQDPWKVTKNISTRRGNKSPPPKQKIFFDAQTGENWEVSVTRAGLTPRSREKYTLGIFETTAEPHTYAAFAKYSRVGTSKVELLTPAKSDKAVAIKAFKEFFKKATGKNWEERADGKLPAPKTDKDGNLLPTYWGWFALEGTGNLFTDWMKSYPGRDESADNNSVANGHAEANRTENGLVEAGHAETGHAEAEHAEADHTEVDPTEPGLEEAYQETDAALENAGEI